MRIIRTILIATVFAGERCGHAEPDGTTRALELTQPRLLASLQQKTCVETGSKQLRVRSGPRGGMEVPDVGSTDDV